MFAKEKKPKKTVHNTKFVEKMASQISSCNLNSFMHMIHSETKQYKSMQANFALPVINRPPDHPHAVIGERCDREAGDQSKSVECGDKDLAEAFVPLVIGVLAAQLDDAVHGDRDAHVEDVRAGQGADQELQRLPLLLLGAHTQDAPGIGQDRHPRADQPGQRIGVDDLILHGAGAYRWQQWQWQGVGWQEEERWVGQWVETGTGPERALLQEKVELLVHVLDRVGGGHCDWWRILGLGRGGE